MRGNTVGEGGSPGAGTPKGMDGAKFTEPFVGVVAAKVEKSLSSSERACGGLVFGAPTIQRSSLASILNVPVIRLVG